MAQNTYSLDSGYAKSGVHWDIHQYKLRYTNLYEVRVNGKSTQFRSKKECYKYLQDTQVTSFRKNVVDGKEQYEQQFPEETKDDE